MMKKRIIAIIAAVLAVLIAVGVILFSLSRCNDSTGKKTVIKKVVVTNNDSDDPDDDYNDDEDDYYDDDYYDDNGYDDDNYDDDPYDSDDINLSNGYDDAIVYRPSDIMTNSSELYQLNVNNDSANVASPFFRGTTGSVYWPTEYLDMNVYNQSYTPEMNDFELSRFADIGLTVLRTGFWTDWMFTGDPENPWDNDSEIMNKFYDFCRDADRYGLKVAPLFGWSYPCFLYGADQFLSEVNYMYPRKLDENGNRIVVERWGYYFEEPDTELMNQRFADWVVASIQGFKDHGITNVEYIFFGNEPREDGGTAEGAFVEYQLKTFSAAHEALKAAGLRDFVKIIGPNQSAVTPRAGLACAFLDRAPGVFDIISTHHSPYGADATEDRYSDAATIYDGWLEKMDDRNLRDKMEFWCDEYITNADKYGEHGAYDAWTGVQQCAGLVAATNAGVTGINYWQIFDQLWPGYFGSGGEYLYGAQRDGSCPTLYESMMPSATFYAHTLFTKYMSSNKNPGVSYRCEAEDDTCGLYVTAVKLPSGDTSVMVVNHTTDERSYQLNFATAMGGKTMYRYLYNVATTVPNLQYNYLPADMAFTNVGDTLVDTVPGGSVVVYSTIKNVAE